MTDYHKVCWYCGKETMEPIQTWYQCSSCGATYVDPVPLGTAALEEGYRNIYDSYHRKVIQARTPSGKAKREAAKARAKKAEAVLGA